MINPDLSRHDMPHVQEPAPFVFFDDSKKRIEAEKVLTGKLILPAPPYGFDTMSPTPLDPFHLRTAGADYHHAAVMFTEKRLDEAAIRHAIPEEVIDAVTFEAIRGHEHRSRKNDEAMKRLVKWFNAEGVSSFDTEEANEIMRARAGVARLSKLALLLTKYPVIGGIEVMKYTNFNDIAQRLAHAAFVGRLHAMSLPTERFVYERIHEVPRLVKIKDQDGGSLPAFKVKEADVRLKTHDGSCGTTLELVSRNNYVALDPELELPGIEPHYAELNGKAANVQQTAVTKYLRLAER